MQLSNEFHQRSYEQIRLNVTLVTKYQFNAELWQNSTEISTRGHTNSDAGQPPKKDSISTQNTQESPDSLQHPALIRYGK